MTIDRRATEDEIEQIEVRENRTLDRPHYVSDSIGRIAGLEALYAENDLKQLLVLDLETHIAEFRDVVITDLTHSELRRWGKWAATVESTLECAQASVTFGQTLLTAANLEPFLKTLRTAADQAQFRAYVRS
ncbi:MAG: hypothetical protein WDO56_35255 [Gammaproteobacteria bacterium]